MEAGRDRCRTRQMLEKKDAGKNRFSTGRIKDRMNAGQVRCSTGSMQERTHDRSDARQEGYSSGKLLERTDAGQDECRKERDSVPSRYRPGQMQAELGICSSVFRANHSFFCEQKSDSLVKKAN